MAGSTAGTQLGLKHDSSAPKSAFPQQVAHPAWSLHPIRLFRSLALPLAVSYCMCVSSVSLSVRLILHFSVFQVGLSLCVVQSLSVCRPCHAIPSSVLSLHVVQNSHLAGLLSWVGTRLSLGPCVCPPNSGQRESGWLVGAVADLGLGHSGGERGTGPSLRRVLRREAPPIGAYHKTVYSSPTPLFLMFAYF